MRKMERNESIAGWKASVAVLFLTASVASCGLVNNVNSAVNCRDYCDKRYDCDQVEPTDDEVDICVNECRDSIEDTCGNDHQADANAQIGECVDMGCAEFDACMVFDVAPECFRFAN